MREKFIVFLSFFQSWYENYQTLFKKIILILKI
jgi:hypothetical protein